MKKSTFLILIAILAIAVFFRLYKITETPPGLYPDEAANGVNALDSLKNSNWKVFFPENNGREGLFINLQALSVKIFGAQPWALRIVSSVFGVLTVLGLFLLTRLRWGNSIALVASYLMAVSFWAVNFSRIGFRAVMLPFVLVWFFYFLWLGLKKENKWIIFGAGLIYGIGFHTYISWRVSPLLIVLTFIILLIIEHRVFNKKFVLKSLFIFGVGAIITMSPLLLYYAQHPADFMGRAAQVSVFNSPDPVKSFAQSAVKTLGMFNFYGDSNWRHNFPGRPLLFWPVGIGFLIGLWLLLKKLFTTTHFFLISWFLVMLLPNFLAPEGAPHALRALGALPAVFIISALGLVWVYKKIQSKFDENRYASASGQARRIKKEIALLAFLVLTFVGVWEFRTYFAVWAGRIEVMENFDQRLTDIGNYLKNLPPDVKKYVIVNETGSVIKGVSIQAQPIMFLNYENEIKYLDPTDVSLLPRNLSNAVIIPTRYEKTLTEELKEKYPAGHLADFVTFKALKIK